MTLQTSLAAPKVTIRNGKAVTTSLDVADYFDKRHDNVLRTIERLDCSEKFTALNFEVSEYTDSTGRKHTDVYHDQGRLRLPRHGLYRQKGSSVQGSLHSGV